MQKEVSSTMLFSMNLISSVSQYQYSIFPQDRGPSHEFSGDSSNYMPGHTPHLDYSPTY